MRLTLLVLTLAAMALAKDFKCWQPVGKPIDKSEGGKVDASEAGKPYEMRGGWSCWPPPMRRPERRLVVP